MLSPAAAELPTPASRLVHSASILPQLMQGELQSSGRSNASEQPTRRFMSLNSRILAAQRDWEEKQRESGRVTESSSGESDYAAESDSADTDGSDSHIDDHVAEDVPDFGMDNPQAGASPKRLSDDEDGLSSSPQPSKGRSRHDTTISVSSASDSGQTQLQKSTGSVNEETEGEDGYAVPSQVAPPVAHHPSTTPFQEEFVYTEYESITKPKDTRETYLVLPGQTSGILEEVPLRAIIPTGYMLKYYASELLLACPVIGCAVDFPDLMSLGGHFCAAHENSAYNDNCDGTLERVGRFAKIAGSSNVAIVVSQIPKSLDMTTATVADRLALDDQARQRRSKIQPAAVSKTNTAPDYVRSVAFQNGKVACSHALSYLLMFYRGEGGYGLNHIHELSQLPKRRDFPPEWIKYHKNREFDEKIFSLSLAYLVGDEVRGPNACRQREVKRACRLSDLCIALPATLSSMSKGWFRYPWACVGCQYWAYVQRHDCTCDWKQPPLIPTDFARQRNIIQSTKPLAERMRRTLANQLPRPLRQVQPHPAAPPSHAQPSQAQEPSRHPVWHSEEENFANPSVEARRSTRRKQHISYTETPPDNQGHDEPVGSIEVPQPVNSDQAPATTESKIQQLVISAENPNAQLSMETWEKAPGRLTDGVHSENIAFSNAYLNGREPVTVSQDVHFNVMVIKPGETGRWTKEKRQIRTCSVASGKVKVKLCGKVFYMGPNGLFVIRPGQQCTVENELYMDSVVHCTTITDYELVSTRD